MAAPRTSSSAPTDKQRIALNKHAMLRGHIIGSYAQIDHLLLDIVLKARAFKPYWSLKLRHQKKLENRINELTTLLNSEGSISRYRDRVESLLSELDPVKDLRDFLAHAYVRLSIKGEVVTAHYRMLRNQNGESELGEMNITLEELEEVREKTVKLAQNFLLLWREIYLDEGFSLLGDFGEFEIPS